MMPGVSMKEIRDAILDAYGPLELRDSVRFLMNEPLHNITMAPTFPNQVFELIDWADRQGRDVELVQALAKDRPKKPLMQQIYKRYGMAVPVGVQEAGGAKAVTDAADVGLEKIVRPHLDMPDF